MWMDKRNRKSECRGRMNEWIDEMRSRRRKRRWRRRRNKNEAFKAIRFLSKENVHAFEVSKKKKSGSRDVENIYIYIRQSYFFESNNKYFVAHQIFGGHLTFSKSTLSNNKKRRQLQIETKAFGATARLTGRVSPPFVLLRSLHKFLLKQNTHWIEIHKLREIYTYR